MGGHKLCKPNYLKVFQSATDYRRTQADDDARMLNGIVRIVKLTADCSHVRPLGVHQKLLHPVHRNHLRIIIQ